MPRNHPTIPQIIEEIGWPFDPDGLEELDDTDLELIADTCDSPDYPPNTFRCVACEADTLWLERKADIRGGNNTPAPVWDGSIHVSEGAKWDFHDNYVLDTNVEILPDKTPDPKENVLSQVDLLRQAVVDLFNTGIALGPVSSPELAELVWGAGKYIDTVRKLWESGISTSTEEQQAEIDRLAAIVERLRS